MKKHILSIFSKISLNARPKSIPNAALLSEKFIMLNVLALLYALETLYAIYPITSPFTTDTN